MAAFPARDWGAFAAHAAKVQADPTVTNRTIVVDGVVAGSVVSWVDETGERDVGYWLGREFWGRGIATQALTAMLALVPERPLHARVAKHNAASLRVLQKCGFLIVGEDRWPSTVGGDDVEDWVLRLAAGPHERSPARGPSRSSG
jgi:RimJ/RimL family protein N-acetyltransferase